MRSTYTLLALGALLVGASFIGAAGPDADANKDYWLSPNDGPYMIYVASYRGDEARDLASQLVHGLRESYRLPAFLYSRSEEERQLQEKWLADLHQKYGEGQRFKKTRIVDDYAVLVGHWKDMDAAQSELKRIKAMPAPAGLKSSGLFMVNQPRTDSKRMRNQPDKAQAALDKTPFSQAFVTRNPLAPKEVVVETKKNGKPDPLWAELNAKEKYSLFKNPKPWTLVVQVYRGAAVTQPAAKPNVFDQANPGAREMAIERGFRISSKATGKGLDAATADAGKLAEALRDKGRGYDAYVMHTRDSSLVTVGGFRGPNDPELLRLQKELKGKQCNGIPLLETPVPMEVPRP